MQEQITDIITAFMNGEEDAQEQLKEFTGKLSDQIPGFVDAALPVLEAVLLSDGMHEMFAEMHRKSFLALCSKGFTDEQAIELIVQTKTFFLQAARR